MAEDKVEARDVNWRHLLPWSVLFQGFWVAMDPKKLVLAAAGILAMSLGWWVLAWPFDYDKPQWDRYLSRYADMGPKDAKEDVKKDLAWKAFREDRIKWNINHEAVGRRDSKEAWELEDVAETRDDFDRAIKAEIDAAQKDKDKGDANLKTVAGIDRAVRDGRVTPLRGKALKVLSADLKRTGVMRTLPWYEDRGPNPYLLVTGQAGRQWEKGQFGDWLLTEQLPILVEPLVKLFLPVKYIFHPKAGLATHCYALLALVWTIAVWALFGGAITRLAVVEVARQEKLGLMEALRYTWNRYLSYFSAPLIPLAFVAVLLVLMMLFGLLHLIPAVGDVVDGLLWPLMILSGLGIALILVGLVGWPLMSATISAEGTEAWEAISRSYNYVVLAPWQYIFYSLVALAYGAAIIFFVGLMGSLMVFLSKWGVSQTPGSDYFNRNPSYLFVYAPTSFGWRELLLQDAQTPDGQYVVRQGEIDPAVYDKYVDSMASYNTLGAILVSGVWIFLVFMLVVGFGYSYFWCASSIIYLLMRRKVDDAEMDEVYLEEEDEGTYSGPLATPSPTPAAPPAPVGSLSLPVVEAPRPVAVPAPPPPPPAPAPVVTMTPPPAPPASEPHDAPLDVDDRMRLAPPHLAPPASERHEPAEGNGPPAGDAG